MEEARVEIFPFHKILFYPLANRLSYRNHRKIIVIDGQTAFTGNINVSAKYINCNGGIRICALTDRVFFICSTFF